VPRQSVEIDARVGGQEPADLYLRLHFADEAGKTRLALRQGPYTQELACLAREGWISSFTKLDALLAGLRTGGTSGAASPGALVGGSRT
jgi:hypothetical protein